MKLIVGLGNPGKEYELTRHNIGYMCVDNYVDSKNWSEKFNSYYQQLLIGREKVIIIKPKTYMNLSGNAVKQFVDYYKINLEDILVIQDDLDFPLGKIRLKYISSDGGHNGIKSITSMLGSNKYLRLKIGISNDKSIDTKDYVLAKFKQSELDILNNSIIETKDIIDSFINNGYDYVLNNKK